MLYAVKSVENQIINKIFTNWDECKPLVVGKKAVYKSVLSPEEAEAFLEAAPVKVEEYGHGYVPSNVNATTIYGKFLFSRCDERDNGYCVYIYETAKKERVTCVGYHLPNNKHLLYAFKGKYFNHKTFGYQFEVESYKEHITDTKDSIVAYLSSGLIKGIGKKRAEAIYDMFRGRTLEIFEKEPERLLMIKGINRNNLKKITDSYQEHNAAREITSYLLSYGLSPKYGMELHKKYGTSAITRIKENPYLLTRLSGITFYDADMIAKKEECDLQSNERFLSCAYHVLSQNEMSGNTGMEINAFGNEMLKILGNVSQEFVLNHTCELLKKRVLRRFNKDTKNGKKQLIFSQNMFELEQEVAKNILRIRNSECQNIDVKSKLRAAETHFNMKCDEIQLKAVTEAMNKNIVIITGGPGTGKTTIIRLIDYLYAQEYPENDRIFLAPTGRAARKVTESTGNMAYTEHSFLKIYEDAEISEEEEVEIHDSLIVVDEFSMTDIYVAATLFRAVKDGCKLVLVGDDAQLQSVGPGAVLRDMIHSGVIKTITLEKLYRQDEDTQIYANALKIRKGRTDIQEGKDFHITECTSLEDTKNMMVETYVANVEEFGLGNVMCLCPFKEHITGVKDMNIALQERINPKTPGKKEIQYRNTIFRIGDLVMQLNNTLYASNGDIGFIRDIEIEYEDEGELFEEISSYKIVVEINQRMIEYDKDKISQLTLAYATTIHKAQGSEAAAVVTTLLPFHKQMLYRNITLVAATRPKCQYNFFGSRDSLIESIKNTEKNERDTLLCDALKYEDGLFVSAKFY